MTESALPTDTLSPYFETLSTWSVRYLHPSGFMCILSIQSETGTEALIKAEGAIVRLVESKCTPVQNNIYSGNQGGHSNNFGSTILVKSDGNSKNPICPIHGIEMQKWSKNGRTWFSHRWESGWCNGQINQKGK